MSDFDLLIDFHKRNERQGPGSVRETEKAVGLIPFDTDQPLKVADIGCGTGGQTMTLSRLLKGRITAVDLFPEFLERLDARAAELGFGDRVETLACSMENLPFQDEEYDLIWSEGAIYLMGFEEGIRAWRTYLKKGGYLAVSDITWITETRPPELEQYWMEECPAIDSVPNKLTVLENSGYAPIAHFILPPYCWIDQYYLPLQESHSSFLARHEHSQEAMDLIESDKQEFELYLKYQDYYSYGFYIAMKM